jgi:hypothetical protein
MLKLTLSVKEKGTLVLDGVSIKMFPTTKLITKAKSAMAKRVFFVKPMKVSNIFFFFSRSTLGTTRSTLGTRAQLWAPRAQLWAPALNFGHHALNFGHPRSTLGTRAQLWAPFRAQLWAPRAQLWAPFRAQLWAPFREKNLCAKNFVYR